MKSSHFRSHLAFRLQSFLEARSRGKIQKSAYHEKILRHLDRFLMYEIRQGETITREVAERFNKSMEHLSPNTRRNRLSVLRNFCVYLSYFDPRTCIIFQSYLPRRTRPAPHIYTRPEIRKILDAARKLGPRKSFRPIIISTLIGFLYATGIRIGEACNLTVGDLDLKRELIQVHRGKFGKSRNVPLSHSTAEEMKKYLEKARMAGLSMLPAAPLFPNEIGRKQGHPRFTTVFLEILRKLGLRGKKGERGPRIHDLRHTFAVERLLAWYRQGANMGAKLPLLSTYLGHSTVTGTQVYLHATAQILKKAGDRFHDYFAAPALIRKNYAAK